MLFIHACVVAIDCNTRAAASHFFSLRTFRVLFSGKINSRWYRWKIRVLAVKMWLSRAFPRNGWRFDHFFYRNRWWRTRNVLVFNPEEWVSATNVKTSRISLIRRWLWGRCASCRENVGAFSSCLNEHHAGSTNTCGTAIWIFSRCLTFRSYLNLPSGNLWTHLFSWACCIIT